MVETASNSGHGHERALDEIGRGTRTTVGHRPSHDFSKNGGWLSAQFCDPSTS